MNNQEDYNLTEETGGLVVNYNYVLLKGTSDCLVLKAHPTLAKTAYISEVRRT